MTVPTETRRDVRVVLVDGTNVVVDGKDGAVLAVLTDAIDKHVSATLVRSDGSRIVVNTANVLYVEHDPNGV